MFYLMSDRGRAAVRRFRFTVWVSLLNTAGGYSPAGLTAATHDLTNTETVLTRIHGLTLTMSAKYAYLKPKLSILYLSAPTLKVQICNPAVKNTCSVAFELLHSAFSSMQKRHLHISICPNI